LKELGYDDSTDLRYNSFGSLGDFLGGIKAPTLYEAQKWLREEKRILILPDYNSFGWFCGIHYPINSVKMFKYTAKEVNSYEEALSEGIKGAVKILKEK
jgi:hypothetical protein